MAGRRANGEGTYYRRRDGRWEGAATIPVPAGRSKRIHAYGFTRGETQKKLADAVYRYSRQLPDFYSPAIPTLTQFLDVWLERVQVARQPTTLRLHTIVAGRHLKPGLGDYQLDELTIRVVQQWFNQKSAEGCTPHLLRQIRTTLSSALHRAQQEGLVDRNVVELLELPRYRAAKRAPWSAADARGFLAATAGHPYHPAFMLLVGYGLRRGELLGLHWGDVDFEHHLLHVHTQLQRLGSRVLFCQIKTDAGQRDLPLTAAIEAALLAHRQVSLSAGKDCTATSLVFTRDNGEPHDPTSFSRTFKRLVKHHGFSDIHLHDLRHTLATTLKDIGFPARDTQYILGHADIDTTLRIYQHVTPESHRGALEKLDTLFQSYTGNRTKGRQETEWTVTDELVGEGGQLDEENGADSQNYCRNAMLLLCEMLQFNRYKVGLSNGRPLGPETNALSS